MEKIKKDIFKIVNKNKNTFIQIRNHLHQYPELSFQEFKTSDYIASKLNEFGIQFKAGFVKTGILGIIKGKNPKKRTIAIRADIDALPIEENKNHKIRSKNEGVMHACGHDIHISCLLSVGKILQELSNEFEGTVLLIFQPGEEKNPGGAYLMLKEGIFNEIEPDWIIGLHVDTDHKTGIVGFKSGKFMASCDELYLTVRGKGGHASMPHKIDDVVLAASSMIVNMQQIISRKCPPATPSVLSFGRFIANGFTNVIPDEVNIKGTFRTVDEDWRKKGHKLIERIATENASMHGVKSELNIDYGYPCLINNTEYTNQAKEWASELWGKKNIIDMDLRMGGEDFAYFAQIYPATFFRIGVCPTEVKVLPGGLHSSNFFADENAIEVGAVTFAWLALSFLNK